jgi:hypothetical protein
MPVFERDDRFPIRATAIKWKGTDTNEVPPAAFVEMMAGIQDYMRIGDASGSLVVDDGAELRATATFATKSDLLGPLAAASISSSSSSSLSTSAALPLSAPAPAPVSKVGAAKTSVDMTPESD